MERPASRLLAVLTALAVVFALRAASPVTLPLAFALFLIGLLWPLQVRLQQIVGRPRLAFGLTLLVFALGVWLFSWILAECVDEVVEQWPKYEDRFRAVAADGQARLQGWGIEFTGQDGGGAAGRVGSWLKSGARTAFAFGGGALLAVALMVLGLLEVQQYRQKISRAFGGGLDQRIARSAQEASRKFGRYFATRTVISIIQGITTLLFALAVGLDLAFLWAVLSALLNYIPTVGSILAIVPPALFALVQFDGMTKALLVVGGLTLIQVVLGNYVDPRIEGRWLALSPFVVLLSITFWGWVWGPAGALIGVPLTIGIAIVCQQFPSTRWIYVLLSDVEASREEPEGEGEGRETT